MDYQLLTELLSKKYSTPDIAKETGLSRSTVRHWMKKYNLQPVYKKGIGKKQSTNRANCIVCGNTLNKNNKLYCGLVCFNMNIYTEYISRWKSGHENGLSGKTAISRHIRRYLFEKYNNQCSQCGWAEKNIYTGRIPLTVEHIDGHYDNNVEQNLTLLCPNCHSLTSTYGSLNKGNGRPTKSVRR